MTQKTAKNQNREGGKEPIPIMTKRPMELPESLHWRATVLGLEKGRK